MCPPKNQLIGGLSAPRAHGCLQNFMSAMLIGTITSIPFWLWQRRFPDTNSIYQLTVGPINDASWCTTGLHFPIIINSFICPVLFNCWVGLGRVDERSERDVELSGRSLGEGWRTRLRLHIGEAAQTSPASWAILADLRELLGRGVEFLSG